MKPKNVQISYELFKSLLWVMDSIDVSNYDEAVKEEFESVLDGLKAKQEALDKRELYSQLINANKSGNEEKQLDTRIEYLRKRNSL